MYLAALSGCKEIAVKMIEYGGDVNSVNEKGVKFFCFFFTEKENLRSIDDFCSR